VWRLLLIAVLPLAFHLNVATVPLLCMVGFGLSAAKLIFDSVIAAAIPNIVQREDLPKANGWIEAANSSAYAIGPAIAGWLTQAASPGVVYLVSFALYLASTLVLRSVSLPQVERTVCESRSHLLDIAEGVRVLWQNEVQRTIAASAALFNLFHSAFFTVFAIYLLKDLSLNASTFGTLMSSVAFVGLFGALCGPKVVAKLGARSTLVGSLLLIGPLGVPIIWTEAMSSPYRVLVIGTCLAVWDFMIVVSSRRCARPWSVSSILPA
jgi:MFS family permease